jgi:glycosyltransferase involved in cell wall biosynthesis
MKILQVTAVDFTVKKFLLPLADDLKKNNYEVHIACDVNEIGIALQNQGYNIKHIPFSRNFNVINHTKALFSLISLIKKEKYDIIHSHTPVASLIARMAAVICRVPLNVYTAHGFYFHENMRPFVYKIAYSLEKIWGKYLTDYLFFQSREDYDLALKHKFNKPSRLIHINNGVSDEKFNPKDYNRNAIRESLGLKDEKVILFVGRLVEEKGIKELLEAFELLSVHHDDFKLILVGGGVTGDRDSLNVEEIVDGMNESVKQNIILLGLRDDIPELLAASDLFTLPSYREGLPRSIIEAMAMGKPIVATNIRGCREEVFEGINGYLCNDRDPKSLADAIKSILIDEEKLSTFGSNSRRIFLEEFEEIKVLNRQMKVFNEFRKDQLDV